MRSNLTIPERLKIKELYLSGSNIYDIEKQFECKYSTVYKILKTFKVFKSKTAPSIKPEDYPILQTMLDQKISYKDIGRYFKISGDSAREFLKKKGFLKDKTPIRKYFPNEDYFDDLKTEDQFWILGWYWTDGCNMIEKSMSAITVQTQDVEVLNKIKKYLDGGIYQQENRNCGILKIRSNKLCFVLNSIGCIPRKSLTLEYPNWIKEENHHRWFLRGAFEGDGWVSIKEGNRKNLNIGISSGSKSFLENMSIILQGFNFDTYIRTKQSGFGSTNLSYALYIRGNKYKQFKFLTWIYGDANLKNVLKRKYQKYVIFKKYLENEPEKGSKLNLKNFKSSN